MASSDVLVRVMDEAAQRVLSGAERAYDIALETAGELVQLDSQTDSTSSWTAYVLWLEISEVFDAYGGPESEELCDELAVGFSRKWLVRARTRPPQLGTVPNIGSWSGSTPRRGNIWQVER